MHYRLRSRDELLAAWRARDSVAAAARDAAAEAFAAQAIDRPADSEAVLRVWAADALRLELAAGQPIPEAVRRAFARAQDALWAGEPIRDPALLVDEPDGP